MKVKRQFTEEHKHRISQARLGKPHPHKSGRKGIPLSDKWKENISKGLKKIQYHHNHTQQARLKMSLARLGNKNCIGRKLSNETKKKISNSLKGHKITGKQLTDLRLRLKNNPPMKGKKHNIHTRKKLSYYRLQRVMPKKDTKPERILQIALKLEGIKFKTHVPLFGQPDIFIQPNLCIFVDGEYWHNYPHGNPHDHEVNNWLFEHGYKIIRFWSKEIKKDARLCAQIALSKLVVVTK